MSKSSQRRKKSRQRNLKNLISSDSERFNDEWTRRLQSAMIRLEKLSRTMAMDDEGFAKIIETGARALCEQQGHRQVDGVFDGTAFSAALSEIKKRRERELQKKIFAVRDEVMEVLGSLGAYSWNFKWGCDEGRADQMTDRIMTDACTKAVAQIVNPKLHRLGMRIKEPE